MNHQNKYTQDSIKGQSSTNTALMAADDQEPSTAESGQEMIDGIPENGVKDMGVGADWIEAPDSLPDGNRAD